jgi:hypothetical protein
MRQRAGVLGMGVVIAAVAASFALTPRPSFAHCDTLSGPVVAEARTALDRGDVTPVLKWVRKEDEAEIREAFRKTLAVRALSEEAKELADRYFLETLVRVHRASEGEPFTGLKAAPPEPIVKAADEALAKANAVDLVDLVKARVRAAIEYRLARALEAKKRAGDSVEAGRHFVAAYVEFVHCVEGICDAAASPSTHHHNTEAAPAAPDPHPPANPHADVEPHH